ncbi:hypothetical protein VFPBJ_01246 [Purpureocillium lilacinum]|uniref:Uncharacterized protein n=1 Tax=Purpureocillium lilacinum TaxID=33203 RepID=A0A179HA95_PURLI|nr:hypothetical protein VFPBJ_01246 [Purpureocillium lilacinum]
MGGERSVSTRVMGVGKREQRKAGGIGDGVPTTCSSISQSVVRIRSLFCLPSLSTLALSFPWQAELSRSFSLGLGVVNEQREREGAGAGRPGKAMTEEARAQRVGKLQDARARKKKFSRPPAPTRRFGTGDGGRGTETELWWRASGLAPISWAGAPVH